MDLMLNEYSAAQGRTVVEVSGEIDVYTAPRLRETLISLVDAGNYHLIVDMEGVEFLDSTGLGVLVGGLKRVRAHDGIIDLVCTQGRILRIFRITGLSKVFAIYDSVDDALASDSRADGQSGALTASDETELARTYRWFRPALRLTRSRAERPEYQPRLRLRPE
jgi:anti-sigma B factor antagonist